jgi:hypothetical protein
VKTINVSFHIKHAKNIISISDIYWEFAKKIHREISGSHDRENGDSGFLICDAMYPCRWSHYISPKNW